MLDKSKPNVKRKDDTTSMTHSPIRPYRHYVVRPIYRKDSASNALFLYLMILIPKRFSSTSMLGNTRRWD